MDERDSFFDGYSGFYEAQDDQDIYEEVILDEDNIAEGIEEEKILVIRKGEKIPASESLAMTIEDYNIGSFVSSGMVAGGTLTILSLLIISIISLLRKAG